MYGPGQFSANTDVRFSTTNNKQTIHMVCLPTTTTIVNYNPTPPRHHLLPTATKAHMYGRPLMTNTNKNDNDMATPSHEPKQHMATINNNAPNTSATPPSPMAERQWSVPATT